MVVAPVYEWTGHLPPDEFDLPAELNRFRELRDQTLPPEMTARMDRAARELAQAHLADRAARVGDVAPGFRVADGTGGEVSLAGLLADGPVVLSFYRGMWCPFCSLELRALRQAVPRITALGASLVAVSGQTPDYSALTAERLDLPFTVLSDDGLAVSRSYGLVYELPDYLVEAYDQRHPIPVFNGTEGNALPVPATYVIDRSGIIRFGFVDPNYTHRADPDAIVDVLETLVPE
jgi:peroxiredoxin